MNARERQQREDEDWNNHNKKMMERLSRSRGALQRLYAPGRWFRMCRDFFKAMSIEEAAVLSMLIDFNCLREEELAQKRQQGRLNRIMKIEVSLGEGWFYSKSASLKHVLNIKQHQHDRIINSLIKRKILQRKLAGIPAARFLFIDYKELDDLVYAALYPGEG